MTDADELSSMLAQRRQDGADKAAIEQAIFQRFGCQRAVMFTDLVGFSRMVEAFGIVHFLQVIQESEALFLPLLQQHQGVCLKREGDSLLVLFEQAAEALHCALDLQAACRDANAGRVAEERIEVCIGYGPVLLIDGREVWGAEVNAASKLGEEMAKGGEILATDGFRQAQPEAAYADHGHLFGSRPVYRLLG